MNCAGRWWPNMKLSDEYTREDILNINFLMFMTSMIMLVMSIIAKVVGII